MMSREKSCMENKQHNNFNLAGIVLSPIKEVARREIYAAKC